MHNRLTHTIKVTAVARAIAVRLLRVEDRDLLRTLGGLDHVVVQAAANAHDLGHPPFGHLGERVLDRLARDRFGLADGFEGNAQTFRILTELEVQGPGDQGLNLTAAVRAAVLKYPWGRFDPDPHPPSGRRRLGALAMGRWARRGEVLRVRDRPARDARRARRLPQPAAGAADTRMLGDGPRRRRRLLAARRRGLPPIGGAAVFAGLKRIPEHGRGGRHSPPRPRWSVPRKPGVGLERLRRRLMNRDAWMFDEDEFARAVSLVGEEFVDGVLAVPYDGSMTSDRAVSGFTSRWIGHFISSVRGSPTPRSARATFA